MYWSDPAASRDTCGRALRESVLAIALSASLACSIEVSARELSDRNDIPTVSLSALPAQAQQTEKLIRTGGPFPYEKDGTVFGNRERLLPARPRGQYLEYTVKTPGAADRGARRIVCGGTRPTAPESCFYTHDHYASFRRIVQ